MSALKKPVAALIGVMAVLLAGLFFAASSQAYPAGVNPTLTLQTTTPACGTTDSFTGSNYQPGESVTVSDNSGDSTTVIADGNGNISGSLTITCKGTDPTTITATGGTSGGVDAVSISVGGSSSGGSSSGSNGGLSSTGVAVIGIGVLGVVLLVGGGLFLVAGKRRKVSI